MARVSGIAESLDSRVKTAAKTHGLNIHTLAGRALAEGVLRHWHHGMGAAPLELKGGLLFDQRVRETSDADVTSVRRYFRHEVHRGMFIIRELLHAEGMDIDYLSDTPQLIDVGHRDPVERWVLRGKVGGVAARSQLDISVGRGPEAFSRAVEITEIPPIIPRLPSLTIACQPLEAAAAEKLLAVVLQPESDMRVKHLSDVVNEALWDGVDSRQVACEVLRVCRHRGIDVHCLPDAIGYERYARLESNWDKHRGTRKTTMPLVRALANAECLWGQVWDEMFPPTRPVVFFEPPAPRAGGIR